MQWKLENLLREKERELKLYQRFLDLKAFCEKEIFPKVDLPVREHAEALEALIEKIIPDPKDRREELFSGEIFVLLCAIYLHDTDLIHNFDWKRNREILNSDMIRHKQLLLNYEIARELNIPESAMEVSNTLIFSHTVRKVPVEWEIHEGDRKAIVRNTKVLASVFNFSHLLLDTFYTNLEDRGLRRKDTPYVILNPHEARIEIDSREGLIDIECTARFPYDAHAIGRARQYMGNAFELFREQVNGRMGFQYSRVNWGVHQDFVPAQESRRSKRFSPYSELDGPPVSRWDEAFALLDRLLLDGGIIVTGSPGSGKTTMVRSFLMSQLDAARMHCFYCELWQQPVNEVRYTINQKRGGPVSSDPDIISICRQLLENGPCFFLIDGCERLANVEEREREKFDRFISFCLDQDSVYLVIIGDKENFLRWFQSFSRLTLSSVHEIRPVSLVQTAKEGHSRDGGRGKSQEIIGSVTMEPPLSMALEEVLNRFGEDSDCRAVLAVMAGDDTCLKRFTGGDINFETCLPEDRIASAIARLSEVDLVAETEYQCRKYYSLSNASLRDHLSRVLGLGEFGEKNHIRRVLHEAVRDVVFLDMESLAAIERWRDGMVFSWKAMGLILGSLIDRGMDYHPFLEKAKSDARGIDIHPILRFLNHDDPAKRTSAVRCLIEIQDKDMINPLLVQLKQEGEREIRNLLIEGIGVAGKKKSYVAIMNILQEIGDSQLRLRAIDLFYSLADGKAKELLINIRASEKDPLVLSKLDSLIASVSEEDPF
jgi:hypothetical protein